MSNAENKAQKILVVEDSKPIAKAYQASLSKEGFEVVVAHNGEQAIEVMENERPDLVLLDLIMPVMDGREVLSMLEENSALGEIPIMVATNSVQDASIVEKASCNVVDYFIKSNISIDELIKKVKGHLS